MPFMHIPMPISERYLPRKWSTATLVPLRSARLRNDGIYVRPIARINIGATTSAMARFGRMYIAVSLGAWELICEMAPRFGNPAINWNTIMQKITVPLNLSMLGILLVA